MTHHTQQLDATVEACIYQSPQTSNIAERKSEAYQTVWPCA